MGTSWSEEAKASSKHEYEAQDEDDYEYIHSESELLDYQQSNVKPSNVVKNNHNHNHNHNPVPHKLPHNCEAILKGNSDTPIDRSSLEKLYQQLYAGVFLNGRTKKYWVDRKGNNCFIIFGSGFKMALSEDPTKWYFYTLRTRDDGAIKVAEVISVAWLEVHGRFHTANLTPGVIYQVAFLVLIKEPSYGWKIPVNFRLTLPNGTKQQHKEILRDKPKGQWLRIPVGEFRASPENVGQIEFSIYEHESGNWKKGLVLKGAVIEPKVN